MIIDGLYFKTKPWEHQLAAVKYFMERDCGALYTDPGTGKSKVFIDLITNRRFKRVIVLGTKKPCQTWVKQFKTHGLPNLFSVLPLLDEPIRDRGSRIQSLLKARTTVPLGGVDVIILNYDVMWQYPLADLLIKFKPDCVIADESHRFKAASGKWTNYMAKLGKHTPCRYILSGTMIAEDPLDAYGQFRFVDPTLFGTRVTDFKARYHNLNAEASMRAGFPILDRKEPYKNMDEFYEKLWSMTFRIPSSVKLPPRKNILYEFDISKKASDKYETISKDGAYESKSGYLLIENALTKVVRLQQATSGKIPLTDSDENTKLYRVHADREAALEELLLQFPPNEPIVIFAKFTMDIRSVQRVCRKLKLGCSEVSGRVDEEQEWQDGETTVIVLQYGAGSESIDLTRARYMFYYTLTHSYTQYYQSKKRTHRPHQNRTCVYYHFAGRVNGKESVDHKIIDALKRKKNLVDEVQKGRAEL